MTTRETWLVLGGSSAVARAFARQLAREGADVVMAGRDQEDLARSVGDLVACYEGNASAFSFDAANDEDRTHLAEMAAGLAGVVNVAVFFGMMPAQAEVDEDPDLAQMVVDANFTGAVVTLHKLAPVLEARGKGVVVGVGSVAGDRGRLPNYVYGAAKAGFHTYLAGLRNRLARKGVHVLTVKPGFMDTAMTFGLPGLFLVASPEEVAAQILKAARKRVPVIYVPWFWKYIMLIIRHVPERIFMRMKI